MKNTVFVMCIAVLLSSCGAKEKVEIYPFSSYYQISSVQVSIPVAEDTYYYRKKNPNATEKEISQANLMYFLERRAKGSMKYLSIDENLKIYPMTDMGKYDFLEDRLTQLNEARKNQEIQKVRNTKNRSELRSHFVQSFDVDEHYLRYRINSDISKNLSSKDEENAVFLMKKYFKSRIEFILEGTEHWYRIVQGFFLGANEIKMVQKENNIYVVDPNGTYKKMLNENFVDFAVEVKADASAIATVYDIDDHSKVLAVVELSPIQTANEYQEKLAESEYNANSFDYNFEYLVEYLDTGKSVHIDIEKNK